MTKKRLLQREVFSAVELASLFGVNPKTIYRQANLSNIPTIKLGRRLFFPKRAIFEWLKTTKLPRVNPQATQKTSPQEALDL